jgi:DNA-binding MurR/RpiR family transcriptional regulator
VVLQYVRDHVDEVTDMDVRTLAKRSNSSTATIVRLAKHLGYSGYAEYRYSLRPHTSQHESESKGDAPIVRRDLLAETRTTARITNPQNLATVSDWLAESNQVVLVAEGPSHVPMEYLYHYLFSAGKTTTYPPNYESALDVIRSSSPSTLVLCASVTGERGTFRLAKTARDCGMRVVSITCSLTSSLVSVSDICLFAVGATRSSDVDLTSRLGIIEEVDAVARTYVHRHPHGTPSEEGASL